MKTQLLQIRVSNQLKLRLEKVADKYEVPISTLARFVLAEFSSRSPGLRITANGFTAAEEQRILHSRAEIKKQIKQGAAEVYNSVEEMLAALEK